MTLTRVEELIPLSEAQALILTGLERAERDANVIAPRWIAPITRKWLVKNGLLVATSLGKGKHEFRLTDDGRLAIQMHRVYISKTAPRPA